MNKHSKERIDLLEELIRNRSQKTTTDIVTQNSFYSYRHANRLFKSLNGESINSFSNKMRLQLAADYLKYTSKSIATIALEIDYESTAAFSKAFKKQYHQTPSEFRTTHNVNQTLKSSEKPSFSIEYIDPFEVSICKVLVSSDMTFEDFYKRTQSTLENLSTNPEQWLLIWDEDPELSKVSASRYYIGIPPHALTRQKESYRTISIQGKYAVFTADSFKEVEYTQWAELAYLVLDLKNIKLRAESYLEWFSSGSLGGIHAFSPFKIAIPIQ